MWSSTNQSRSLIFADIIFFFNIRPSDCCARLQSGVGSTQGWYAVNLKNRSSRKLHLKDKRPFLQHHTYFFYQQPGNSNWFQSILSLSFW